MESLELKIFREVAAEKSISRAAEKLNYVQSNVTAHIKHLEEELGVVLFLRNGKGVTITRDGEKLLYYANTILDMFDKAAAAFFVDKPFLRIGASQTLAASRLPIWLSAYKDTHPNVEISVKTDKQTALLHAVNNHEIDCAFIQPMYLEAHSKTLFRFDEYLCIAAPFGYRVQDLKALPVIVNHLSTCPYRKMLMDWYFNQYTCFPEIIEFDTLEAIIHSVSLGMGMSLLPTYLVTNQAGIESFCLEGINKMNVHLITSQNQQSKQVYQFAEIVETFQI